MQSETASYLQVVKEPCGSGLSVLFSPDRPSIDIVFVHGFTGHPEHTWSHEVEVRSDLVKHDDANCERPSKRQKLLLPGSTHRKKSDFDKAVYWPRDLLPATVPHARVLTYGYDTHVRHRLGPALSKDTVYDIAWDMIVSLEAARRSEPLRSLLFIAHSLGGIVVKEALRRSHGCKERQSHLHNIYESTVGILFFGTPHGGADPRGLIQHIIERLIRAAGWSVNEQIVNTLLPSSERLKELREEFGPMARQQKWIIYSFQEQYGVKALSNRKVVEDSASCLNDLDVEVPQRIARNHMDMCRFTGLQDVEYMKVLAAIERVLKTTQTLNPLGGRPLFSAEQRRLCLDSLRFDQIDARHATIKTAHAKTCKWLLDKSEYQDWLNIQKLSEHHGFLWIKGKPGTGKSTILKFACAHAKKNINDTIISFFFNARGEHLEKSVLGMYRSLLVQLLEKLPDLQTLFDACAAITLTHVWDIEMVRTLFRRTIEKLGQRSLTCFIDALDECEEDQAREMVDFFEQLGELAISSQSRFYVCFSSRHYPHITIDKGIQLVLEGEEGHEQDMANYLQSELKAGNSSLIQQIKLEIRERASGIFLWVVLVVQMLNKEYAHGRIHALRKRLDEIPNGLDELFKNILTRDAQNMVELVLCLQWIIFARRPLKREELYFAVLTGVELEAVTPWDSEEITKDDMERFILSSSKGLAEVTKSRDHTVQFIHESVRDFLVKGNGLCWLQSDIESNFPAQSHQRLMLCCKNYIRTPLSEYLRLSSSMDTASSTEAASLRQAATEKFPFLEYAVTHVLYHADAASGHGAPQDDFVENFALGDWINLDKFFEKYQVRRHTSDASLLYILAEKNLPNLIRIELKRVLHMDIKGERYGYPMLAALANKNGNAVRALLIPDSGAWSGWNVSGGHVPYSKDAFEEVIEYLLSNGRDVSSRKHQTLLAQAAERGDVSLAKVLLASRKVDINARTRSGLTPLLCAAARGHEAIVELLLASEDADVELQGGIGRTSRSFGPFEIHPDPKDMEGRTPLSWAAQHAMERIIQLLLDKDGVDLNSKDNNGRTPLSWAAQHGTASTVQLLLDKNGVDPNLRDNNDRTPLSWAAQHGIESTVQLLLDKDGIDLNSKDNNGRTPLSWATQQGTASTVQLLLDKNGVDLNSKDSNGQTPFSWAAQYGKERTVELLLDKNEIDLNSKDNDGLTPLSCAAQHGTESTVQLLLDKDGVDLNSKDSNGRTSLSWAAQYGKQRVIKLLLDKDGIELNSKDNNGRTPLSWAAQYGKERVVELLLDKDGVDLNSEDNGGRTPLSLSVYPNISSSVASKRVYHLSHTLEDYQMQLMLLNQQNKKRLLMERSTKSPGYESVLALLLANDRVDQDRRDKDGRTPFSWAAQWGNEKIIELLLDKDGVDLNSKDNDSRTPLFWAAHNENKTIVQLLLDKNGVNPDSKDKDGGTSLLWATHSGHEKLENL